MLQGELLLEQLQFPAAAAAIANELAHLCDVIQAAQYKQDWFRSLLRVAWQKLYYTHPFIQIKNFKLALCALWTKFHTKYSGSLYSDLQRRLNTYRLPHQTCTDEAAH